MLLSKIFYTGQFQFLVPLITKSFIITVNFLKHLKNQLINQHTFHLRFKLKLLKIKKKLTNLKKPYKTPKKTPG